MVTVPDGRQGLDQPRRVGVTRGAQHGVGSAGLDDPPGVHDRDPAADLLHDTVIVRHQQHGEAEVPGQVLQQAQDLCLGTDVERAGGLVRHQEPWLGGDRHRDHHSLALATG